MNVVYAMTRNFYHKIIPSMKSLIEHNPKVKIYILAEDDEVPNLPAPATIINISDQTQFDKGVNINNRFGGKINLLKVYYPNLLPRMNKVIHLDLDGDIYYNAGVMLINLQQMRKDNIMDTMAKFLNDVPQPFADQDAWNKYGIEQDKIVVAPFRYNECISTRYSDNPAVVHYCAIPDWYENRSIIRHQYLDKYR